MFFIWNSIKIIQTQCFDDQRIIFVRNITVYISGNWRNVFAFGILPHAEFFACSCPITLPVIRCVIIISCIPNIIFWGKVYLN